MEDKKEKYKSLHKLCFENIEILRKADRCVCFYCCKRFNFKEIEDWIKDRNNDTAQCPYCMIDSVIPEVVDGKRISDEELKEMNKLYF